jgi:hypothetical protein
MRRLLLTLPVTALVAGCASSTGKTVRYTAGQQDMRGAVTQPLEDFNLMRDKIPAALRRARAAPYAAPDPNTCSGIRYELAQLDDALGPDADVLDPSPSGRMAQGAVMAGKSVVSAVRDLTTGWIPLRNWVRTLTGAERHSSELRKTVNAGLVRRAYLKGIAQSQECPIVASPAPSQFPAPPLTPSSAGG